MSREGDDMTDATRADGEELDSLLDGETGALLGASLRPVDPPAPMRAALPLLFPVSLSPLLPHVSRVSFKIGDCHGVSFSGMRPL